MSRAASRLKKAPTKEFRVSHTDHDRNKANVVAFYDMMFNQARAADAIKIYAGKT